MTARYIRDHNPIPAALCDDGKLPLVRPIPAPSHTRNDLHPPYQRGLGFDLTVKIRVETIAPLRAGNYVFTRLA